MCEWSDLLSVGNNWYLAMMEQHQLVFYVKGNEDWLLTSDFWDEYFESAQQ